MSESCGKTTTALPFFRLFSADQSFEERLESLVLRLTLSLLISWRHFLMKNSKDANWPQLWGSPFRLSNRTCFKRFFFSTSRLTENSSVFSEIGTKFMHLLRTDFSVSESGKFSGMAATVLRFAGDESLVV